MIQREHIYQVTLHKWVREYVLGNKEFFAFDRAKAGGRFSHMRQRAAGMKKATPDTLLRVRGFPPIWWECKAQGQKPDPDQMAMGERLQILGDHWGWGATVEQYSVLLVRIGVPLARGWLPAVYAADAGILAKIEAAGMKAGNPPKRWKVRAEKPSAGRIKKMHALRGKVMV